MKTTSATGLVISVWQRPIRVSLICLRNLRNLCQSVDRTPSPRQKPQHTGTKVEGFATVVTPDSITVFDKKNQMIEIHTDKDYTALVGIAAPVTVWYTTESGVNHLEDIMYPTRGEVRSPRPDPAKHQAHHHPAASRRTWIMPKD